MERDYISRQKWKPPAFIMDDMIKDVIRVTFKVYHDVIKSQGETIKELQRQVDSKADKDDVELLVKVKACSHDNSSKIKSIERELSRKADAQDVERKFRCIDVDGRIRSAMCDRFNNINETVSAKCSVDDMKQFKDKTEEYLDNIHSDMFNVAKSLDQVRLQLQSKVSACQLQTELRSKADRTDVQKQLGRLVDHATLSEAMICKADKMESQSFLSVLRNDLNSVKTKLESQANCDKQKQLVSDVNDLKQRVQYNQDQIQSTLTTLSKEWDSQISDQVRKHTSSQQQYSRLVNKFENLDTQLKQIQNEVPNIMQKVRETQTVHLDEQKEELDQLKQKLDEKADATMVLNALNDKAPKSLLENVGRKLEFVDDAEKKMIILKQDIARKANVQDICQILDSKANVSDVNQALVEVSDELDKRALKDGLSSILREQGIMHQLPFGEQVMGRWLWKSGRVKQGGSVPWNVQCFNTDDKIILWEKDRPTVQTSSPGLYEITFGFYARKRPHVQLLVNGEAVISAVNSSSYVLHHSSGRLATVSNHPAGNVTGLTCIDFLSLPADARIALTYQSEEKGEGFLSLKKL